MYRFRKVCRASNTRSDRIVFVSPQSEHAGQLPSWLPNQCLATTRKSLNSDGLYGYALILYRCSARAESFFVSGNFAKQRRRNRRRTGEFCPRNVITYARNSDTSSISCRNSRFSCTPTYSLTSGRRAGRLSSAFRPVHRTEPQERPPSPCLGDFEISNLGPHPARGLTSTQ